MTDGHTEEGAYKVTLELTADQVQQLKRLTEMAKQVKAPLAAKDPSKSQETMDILAYRAFLEEILQTLAESLKI